MGGATLGGAAKVPAAPTSRLPPHALDTSCPAVRTFPFHSGGRICSRGRRCQNPSPTDINGQLRLLSAHAACKVSFNKVLTRALTSNLQGSSLEVTHTITAGSMYLDQLLHPTSMVPELVRKLNEVGILRIHAHLYHNPPKVTAVTPAADLLCSSALTSIHYRSGPNASNACLSSLMEHCFLADSGDFGFERTCRRAWAGAVLHISQRYTLLRWACRTAAESMSLPLPVFQDVFVHLAASQDAALGFVPSPSSSQP